MKIRKGKAKLLIAVMCIFCMLFSSFTFISAAPEGMNKTNLMGYWANWGDPGLSFQIKLRDVDPRYDVIFVAFAEGDATGHVTFSPYNIYSSPADFTKDVDYLRSQGKKVVISVGGAVGSFPMDATAQKNEFISSINSVIDTYHFDGIDVDIEGSKIVLNNGDTDVQNPTTPNIVNWSDAIRQVYNHIKASGKEPVITLVPEVAYVQGGYNAYSGIWGAYLPLIHKVRDILTSVNVQYYNTSGMYALDGKLYTPDVNNPDFLVAMTDMLLKGFTPRGSTTPFPALRADQVGFGFPVWDGTPIPTVDCLKKALRYIIEGQTYGGAYVMSPARYVSFRGIFDWNINWDKCQHNYAYAEQLRPLIDEFNSIQPDITPPTAPSNLTVTGKTSTSISLSWGASADEGGIFGYDVFMNGNTTPVLSGITSTKATVKSLTANTGYSFTVKAKDNAGNISSASNSVSDTTLQPGSETKIEAESFNSKSPSLAVGSITDSGAASQAVTQCTPGDWTCYNNVNFGSGTASIDFRYANAYAPMVVELRLGSQNGALIGTADLPLTGGWSSFSTITCDVAGASGVQNLYLVFRGNYPYLNWFSFCPAGGGSIGDTQAPAAPGNLISTGKTDTSVSLSWTAATDNVGVTGYEVYRNSTLAATVAGTTATVTGLTANTAYTFTVKAKDAAGNVSAASNAVNITTNGASVSTKIEAEAYTARSSANVGNYGSYIGARPNEWTSYANVDLTGKTSIDINYSNAYAASSIEIRLGSPSGALIGTVPTPLTANWSAYNTATASISGTTGVQTVYLVYTANNYDNISWLEIR